MSPQPILKSMQTKELKRRSTCLVVIIFWAYRNPLSFVILLDCHSFNATSAMSWIDNRIRPSPAAVVMVLCSRLPQSLPTSVVKFSNVTISSAPHLHYFQLNSPTYRHTPREIDGLVPLVGCPSERSSRSILPNVRRLC